MLIEQDATPQTNLNEYVTLQGKRKDTHDNDWQSYAYAKSVEIAANNPTLIDDLGHYAVMAAVRYKYDSNKHKLSRADAALCARIIASADMSNTAVVFAYTIAPDSSIEARLAVAAGNQVNMTVSFDPKLPSPSARSAINQLLQSIRRTDAPIAADRLLEPLEVAPLRQRFYREVATWTGDLQRGKNLADRQAILRHLIRVIFAWILKEENIIPPELFEQAFIRVNYGEDADKYHNDVLRFLFHQRLNIPRDKWSPHGIDTIEDAMMPTPFLNGSLFAEHSDDDLLDIPASQYWNTDTDNLGLFTILSRYHWTTDEHRPGESEQTLDPELLSNLFERLITPTREGTQPPLRQPKGTYYTPADVADEMVKDALAAAVRDHAPQSVSESELLDLFGEVDAEPPQMTDTQREVLAERIKQLRIFDPAVGSGEFLFSMLLALQRALGKLEPDKHSATTDIIKRQLAGQDIQPLAVQIARLRLFIAIIAARKNTLASDEPLPNLEARIVCADTLQTSADPQWRPDRPGRFDTANPELIHALTELADNRAKWFAAHTEQDKQLVLTEDTRLRDRLRILLQKESDFASPELIGFADALLYDKDPEPAHTDARLLFYENPWRGFDIVIGNPPYEALNKSMRREQIGALKTNKRYQTTNVGDLYSLFCETALALANPDGGVVTMIVPLSIAFGRRQRTLRAVFENGCREINLRHYDIRPDTIFNASPTVRTPSNSQRASIITAMLFEQETVIKSTGLQRWPTSERDVCLMQHLTTEVPLVGENITTQIASQWPRIPTEEIAELVQAITSQNTVIESLSHIGDGGSTLAFPKTARYFISSIPAGAVSPRNENHFIVPDKDTLSLIIAALNGHIAYGWWRVYGDGFHINPYELTSLTIPDAWMGKRQPAIDIGMRLINAIPDCIIETPNRGTVWRNVDFRKKPDLIEELDRMHLEALGFTGAKQDKLLSHLRTMCSNSSWKYD
ncbi:MAG: Eco57I restriction-modification methylase domain-containing protein [Chloroflexi bacterium]|nr:Eco57I restriction-modification methylase domain-containing protein [Chloroflexota bacterium]